MLILFLMCLVLQKYHLIAKLARMRGIMPHDQKMIMNLTEFPPYLLESFITFLHFPPFLDYLEYVKTHVNIFFMIFTTFYLLKFLTCIELMRHFSPLNTSKGRFVGSLSKTKITTSFLIKAWIRSYPLIALPVGIGAFLLANAYLLYVIERDFYPTDGYL